MNQREKKRNRRGMEYRMPGNDEFDSICEEILRNGGGVVIEETSIFITPTNFREEVGQPTVMNFLFDASGSMQEFYGVLATEFNQTMIPGLEGASKRNTRYLRLGATLFAENRLPLWNGFRSVKEAKERLLTKEMFYDKKVGSNTALYQAMISGLVWTGEAVKRLKKERAAKGILIVLTDGANNLPPRNSSEVLRLTQAIKNKAEILPCLAYFKTDEGLTREQFNLMAQNTGFISLGYYEIAPKSKGKEERQRSFRHQFGLLSSQSEKMVR